MTKQEADEMVRLAALKLGEHFDSVQIMASYQLDEAQGTYHIKRGCGSWYARQGMAHEFINDEQAKNIAYEIAQTRPPESIP